MKCLQCDGPLLPHYEIHWRQVETTPPYYTLEEASREEKGLGYNGDGYFCTVDCGFLYGVRKAGEKT